MPLIRIFLLWFITLTSTTVRAREVKSICMGSLEFGCLIFISEMYPTGYPPPHTHTPNPYFVCRLWGLIEICDSSTGCGRPLDECPWASLITLGCLAVPGQCELCKSLLGSIIYDCQSDVSLLHLFHSTYSSTVNFNQMCSKILQGLTGKCWVASLCCNF